MPSTRTFATNGFFYVDLINSSGNTEIRRYQVSSDPNVADPASATTIITINQPAGSNNHKGGWLGFGPDGDLYASLGDGGGSGDTFHNGQNPNSLLGKILRIDVHSRGSGLNYHIPADNPFVGQAGVRGEIFALGLRNPWRPSFDSATGTLYIADVGQDTWEEIDIGQKGANYGWNHFEGPATFPGGDAISTLPVSRRSIPITTPSGTRSRVVMSSVATGTRCRVSISSPTSFKGRSSRCASTAARGSPPIEPRKS